MQVAVIVQARMTSKRLPGKVLKEVMGKPLLGFLLERLKRVRHLHHLVVATTTNAEDDPIVEYCEQSGFQVFRGSEEDVLERYYQAACSVSADVVVRVTSDCPLIDPSLIDRAIFEFLNFSPRYDYLSNTLTRTYPRGMDVEVFSFESLERAHLEAKSKEEREHVTVHIHRNLPKEKKGSMRSSSNESHYRWTVDTQEDFELIQKVLEHLYTRSSVFSLDDLLLLFREHPEWMMINGNVQQKVIC